MLFNFTIGNFRSFSDKKTLSMELAPITDYPKNIVKKSKYKFLSTAVVYGANSSGKSNLLEGISVMKNIIEGNFEKGSTALLRYEPFSLNIDTENQPTFFEIVFLAENTKYRYGFENDQTAIKSEWLFEIKGKTEKALFLRENDGIEVMADYKEGEDLEIKTRDNALFLSVVDQFNGKIAAGIMNWFRNFNIISGINHNQYREFTLKEFDNPKSNKILTDYFIQLDLGFEAVKIEKEEVNIDENISKNTNILVKTKLNTIHKVFDNSKKFVRNIEFDALKQESSGTNKMIDLSGAIFYALEFGEILVIDELDAKLHPLLTLSIIKLFQNPKLNKNGAQLIFATHDTNILSRADLRRDQIYFVEKDNYGASDLYSLVEYDEVKLGNDLEEDYMRGRYGAIPYFNTNLKNTSSKSSETTKKNGKEDKN